MIRKLSVQNFKSIKDLQLDCRRVNLFIGEPNVGKSNILEALSVQAVQQTLTTEGLIRLTDFSNLFYENDTSNKIEIKTDEMWTKISHDKGVIDFSFFKDENFQRLWKSNFQIKSFGSQGTPWDFGIHPYYFKVLKTHPVLNFEFLSSPNGDNLFLMLQTNKALRQLVGEFVQDRGFKLNLKQANYAIEISKENDGFLTTYPYEVISDTLQRIIFYMAALETNKDGSTLLFEEPESSVFPYYTKYLAERIAYNGGQQFFMTTHSPYFLQSLIQKTSIDELQVNVVLMNDNLQTIVKPINGIEKIEQMIDLDSSVFLNLDKLIDE